MSNGDPVAGDAMGRCVLIDGPTVAACTYLACTWTRGGPADPGAERVGRRRGLICIPADAPVTDLGTRRRFDPARALAVPSALNTAGVCLPCNGISLDAAPGVLGLPCVLDEFDPSVVGYGLFPPTPRLHRAGPRPLEPAMPRLPRRWRAGRRIPFQGIAA